MKITEKQIHKILLAFLFTLMNWTIVNNIIVEVDLIRWIFIEILLGFSIKLFNFTLTKLQ